MSYRSRRLGRNTVSQIGGVMDYYSRMPLHQIVEIWLRLAGMGAFVLFGLALVCILFAVAYLVLKQGIAEDDNG